MATALRPIGHEERLSLVEHLDELRSRLLVSLAALTVAFALCAWQSDTLLDILNRPLERTQNVDGKRRSNDPLEQSARFQLRLGEAVGKAGVALGSVGDVLDGLARERGARAREVTPAQLRTARRRLDAAVASLGRAADAVPRNRQRRPVTLGVGEPFVTTLTVAGYAALLLALPVILYQLYAFVLPAFSPQERRVALPLMTLVPFLFMAGVVFGYFVVLPPAISFLQNFNDDSFDILLQARDYYRFAVLSLAGLGLLFQIPVAILAVTRLGLVTPRQLRRNRRYAVLVIAVVAMLLPGTDPVTMLLSMVPLLLLFELSILLASWLDRRRPSADPDAEPDPEEA